LAPYTKLASAKRERLDYAPPTSKVRTLQEGFFRVRTSLLQVVLIFYLLTIFSVGGFLSPGNISSKGLDDSSSERYGWWVGSSGKDGAVDIGFKGSGLQIEVVRSRLKLKIDTPVGLGWTHNYLMYIQRVSDQKLKLFSADGSESVFTSTTSGTFTSQEEDARVLTDNGDGTLSLQDGTESVFRFNHKGRLTHIQGIKYGNTISLAYGADGYLGSISDAQGHVITFYYDSETHRLTAIRDGRGRSASYKHDDIGHLISVTNAKGITSAYTYDRYNNLAGVIFP
jgi:YD repeat-containing protein